ncbi:DUF488 domain-containing protein [Aggregatilinea lenta]|uniref:DUF488 domain-containing protein n=1 Tax=Aggregatilinea lenta TaxID=913108 RepID=UPI000E5A9346|nr:DUF488 domain-containing protein [Aggregatilinea lenta]
MTLKLITTIGVYGFTADHFFDTLTNAKVDTFCDVRFRRGVRGPEYAFANSQRLQTRLEALGIRYLHLKDLAPSDAIRKNQQAVDKKAGTGQRGRTTLSAPFIAAYQREVLRSFDASAFLETLGDSAEIITLCCVERWPDACHRSLLADRLAHDLGVEVQHLLP